MTFLAADPRRGRETRSASASTTCRTSKRWAASAPSAPCCSCASATASSATSQALQKPRESRAVRLRRRARGGDRQARAAREQGAALDYVAGYACFNDGSVRDFQRHSAQFTPGKNFHASGSFGPWLVTTDEVADPRKLTLTTRLNGAVMQQRERRASSASTCRSSSSTARSWTQLEPGDVIVTGTPGGVGAGRKPPRVDEARRHRRSRDHRGLGTLRNPIVADPPREAAAPMSRAALPRDSARQRWRATLAASRTARASRAAAQPDLSWVDREAVASGEIIVNADRGDRPLTVLVQRRGRGRRAAGSDLGHPDGLRDRARVRAERRELHEGRGARRRPRRAVRADDQAGLLLADVRARVPPRLHAVHAHRRAPRQRADRAHGGQLVAPAASRTAGFCWSTSVAVDPGLPIPRFLVRATMKRDLPKSPGGRPRARSLSPRPPAQRTGRYPVFPEPGTALTTLRGACETAAGLTVPIRCVSRGRAALVRFDGCGTVCATTRRES